MPSDLTQEMVKEAMSRQPEVLEDGRVQCPVCPRIVLSRPALAPHMLSHRRAVGLAPPRGPNRKVSEASKRTPRTCPRCGKQMRHDNLRRHLITTHGCSPREASDLMNQSYELVAVEEPPPDEPVSVLTDISAVEAVTGILNAARRDGVIPTRLLPSAFNLAHHVEAVLDELRRLTGKEHR